MSDPLPEKAADTSAERPWPLRLLSLKVSEYVDRMSPVWIEGQLVQLNRRPGSRTCYVTLRDSDVDMSMTVTVPVVVLDRMPIGEGSRVVVHAKPTFWARRGTLQLEARDMRPVGEGELLARLEHLKRILTAEGLFSADRKKPLPFLPRRVGLVCGRASAAMRDVLDNARRRWPAVEFEVREVPVQGTDAVSAVTGALRDLDAEPAVDVIVITRGGGSFEDLLPFSNEALVRAVSDATTPVVSAIGHEVDTPLLDFVADLRASTPTDAAKRIVPDVEVERAGIDQAADRARSALASRITAERRHLSMLRDRPVLTDPHATLAPHRSALDQHRDRADRAVHAQIERGRHRVDALSGRLRALSPQGTLDRGYAIVMHADGRIVSDREDVDPKEVLRVRVARGDFGVRPVTRKASR